MLAETDSGQLSYVQVKDKRGFDAFYFLMVDPGKEAYFKKIMGRPGSVELTDYGQIVASGYGRAPHQAAKDFIKENFNVDAEALIAAAKAGDEG